MDYGLNGEYMDYSFLKDSVGKKMMMERGGPDKVEGILRRVKGDYIVMQTKDGVVYMNANHIKVCTEALVAGNDGEEWGECEMIEADNFFEILESLHHRLIKINNGGPNCVQGVLIETRNEAITLIHDTKEYVHFATGHIRSVSPVTETKKEEKKEDNNGKKDEGKNEGKEERRSGDDRRDSDDRRRSSGSRRSSGTYRSFTSQNTSRSRRRRSKKFSNSRPVRF